MKHSDSIIKIAPALLSIQKELKNTAQTAVNPFFKSKYAPLNKILDEVRPIASKNGIVIIQDVKEERGQINVSTMLLHESGEWIQQEGMTMPLEKNTAQSAGSAVTYGRRYTISAMFGIATEEDDDGNEGEIKINKVFNPIKAEALIKPEDKTTKLVALPDPVKAAFKALAYNRQEIETICEKYSWDNVKILEHLNAAGVK
jgi:hypothetical protein